MSIAQDLDDTRVELTALIAIGELQQKVGNIGAAQLAFEQVVSLYKSGDAAFSASSYIDNSAFSSDFRVVLKTLSEIYWESKSFDKMVSVLAVTSRFEESESAIAMSNFGNVEALANLTIAVGSVEQDTLISLYLNQTPTNTTAAQTSLLDILRRKGRVLENLAAFSQAVWQAPTEGDSEVREALNRTYAAISNLQLSGPGELSADEYKQTLSDLEGDLTTINYNWRTARNASANGLITSAESVSVESVQALIPANAALVEMVQYRVYGATDSETYHYAAYVMTGQGEVKAVDLGDAAAINQQAALFRQALRTRSANIKDIARQLDEQLMAPVRQLTGDKTHLLISPDSQLNAIPFDALVDEQNRYLVESYQISYLNSGRDLLSFQQTSPSQQPPVVVANPDYVDPVANPVQVATSIATNQRSLDFGSLTFSPLPGTAQEAAAIMPLLPQATLLAQSQATENAIKQLQAPSILHIATHGFFLPDLPLNTDAFNARGASLEINSTETTAPLVPKNNYLENPLLRSGLALAGVNARSSGNEDGILTALEASGLNLHGTELVVLSACETGLGTVSSGEGIYGLRRAFAIAGAKSQLMSLWQVDDTGTSELMQLYYENLIEKKQGRSEALRSAQLTMMHTGTYAHPYYWSSFISSGDWRPLNSLE